VPSLETIKEEAKLGLDHNNLDKVISIHEALASPTSDTVKKYVDGHVTKDEVVPVPTVITKDSGTLEPTVAPRDGQLITQTDAAAFLYEKRSHLNQWFAATLSELKLDVALKETVSVRTTESALLGFRRLMQWKIGLGDLAALPVIGESGVILTVLSATDLRSITKLTLSTLLLPVLDYLVLTHGAIRAPVVCRSTDTLEHAMKKILDARVHRAFLVDAGMHVVGVVSLTDILKLFSSHLLRTTRF
jgi:hypothetical protein